MAAFIICVILIFQLFALHSIWPPIIIFSILAALSIGAKA